MLKMYMLDFAKYGSATPGRKITKPTSILLRIGHALVLNCSQNGYNDSTFQLWTTPQHSIHPPEPPSAPTSVRLSLWEFTRRLSSVASSPSLRSVRPTPTLLHSFVQSLAPAATNVDVSISHKSTITCLQLLTNDCPNALPEFYLSKIHLDLTCPNPIPACAASLLPPTRGQLHGGSLS